jgi:predicted TIM-barrel fold metal-dependent hydrolase
MVFDTHCHVHLYPEHLSERMADIFMTAGRLGDIPVWWDKERTWTREDLGTDLGRLISDMDRAEIDRAFLLSQCWAPYETHTPPEYVAEVVSQFPDKFIGFWGSDPLKGSRSVRDLQRAYDDYHMRGVKLSPAYNHVALNDARLYPIYCKAEELDIPVLIHTGWTWVPGSRIEAQHPLLLDEVAETFPSLKIVVAHMGFQWSHETIMLMRKHPNVWADLAFWESTMPLHFIADSMVWAKRSGVIDRVLWGSDYPSSDPAESVALHRRIPNYTVKLGLEPVITEEDTEGILGLNAQRLASSIPS